MAASKKRSKNASARPTASSARSKATRQAYLQAREAGEWFSSASRTVLDHAAIGSSACSTSIVEWIVDWEAGRETVLRAERSQADPEQAARLRQRRTDPQLLARLLYGVCRTCENPPAAWPFPGDCLAAERPGARDPIHCCEGCPHALRGTVDMDRSLAAAFDSRGVVENHERFRREQVALRERERRERRGDMT